MLCLTRAWQVICDSPSQQVPSRRLNVSGTTRDDASDLHGDERREEGGGRSTHATRTQRAHEGWSGRVGGWGPHTLALTCTQRARDDPSSIVHYPDHPSSISITHVIHPALPHHRCQLWFPGTLNIIMRKITAEAAMRGHTSFSESPFC